MLPGCRMSSARGRMRRRACDASRLLAARRRDGEPAVRRPTAGAGSGLADRQDPSAHLAGAGTACAWQSLAPARTRPVATAVLGRPVRRARTWRALRCSPSSTARSRRGSSVSCPGRTAALRRGSSASTSSGVTRISSSTSLILLCSRRNAAPRYGTSISQGMPRFSISMRVCTKPAMASVWPTLHFDAGVDLAHAEAGHGRAVDRDAERSGRFRSPAAALPGGCCRCPARSARSRSACRTCWYSIVTVPKLCGIGTGISPPRVEVGRAAADGHQLRLGQDLEQVVLLQGVQACRRSVAAVDDAERRTSRRRWWSRSASA